MLHSMSNASDQERLTGDLLRLGRVASVDLDNALCTVETGDLITGPLPWLAGRAGAVLIWSPPTIGEQCLLLSPEGDTENGIVLLGLYSTAFPTPSRSPDLHSLDFKDGARIAYDMATKVLTAFLPDGASAAITAPGGVSIVGDVTVTGTINATVDVVGAGVSLKAHKHGGVQAGAAQTGGPV